MGFKKKENNQQKNANENLLYLDDESYKVNLLTIKFLINKLDTCMSSLKMYLDLIQESSLMYNTYKKLLYKLDSLYGAKLFFKVEALDYNYLVTASIKSLSNRYVKGFKNIQLESIRLIHSLLNSNYSGDKDVFNKCVNKNIESIVLLENSDDFRIKNAVHLNFLDKLSYGNYPFGTIDEFKKTVHIDLENAKKAIFNSQIIVSYIGDCSASAINLVNSLFKPTPFIPPLRSGDFLVKQDHHLVTKVNTVNNLLSIVFSYSDYSSTVSQIIDKIIIKALNKILIDNKIRHYLLPKNFEIESLYKGNIFIYQAKVDLTNATSKEIADQVKHVVLNAKDYISEEVFDFVKQELKREYSVLNESIDNLNEFILNQKLLGFETNLDKYILEINDISYSDFCKKLNLIKVIGSICLESNKGGN